MFGQAEIEIEVSGKEFPSTFQIMKSGRYDLILGRPFLSKYKAVIDLELKLLTLTATDESKVEQPLGRQVE